MTRCLSVFYGVQCGKWLNHAGSHAHVDSSDHITYWNDLAADPTPETK